MLQKQIKKSLEDKLLGEMVTLNVMDTTVLKILEIYDNEIAIANNTIFRSETQSACMDGEVTYTYRHIDNPTVEYYFVINFQVTEIDENELYNTDVVVEEIDWV